MTEPVPSLRRAAHGAQLLADIDTGGHTLRKQSSEVGGQKQAQKRVHGGEVDTRGGSLHHCHN